LLSFELFSYINLVINEWSGEKESFSPQGVSLENSRGFIGNYIPIIGNFTGISREGVITPVGANTAY